MSTGAHPRRADRDARLWRAIPVALATALLFVSTTTPVAALGGGTAAGGPVAATVPSAGAAPPSSLPVAPPPQRSGGPNGGPDGGEATPMGPGDNRTRDGGDGAQPGDGGPAVSASRSGDAAEFRVTGARAGEPVGVPLAELPADPRAVVSLREMTVTANRAGDFQVRVATRTRLTERERERVRPVNASVGEPALYLNVSPRFANATAERATFTFQLRRERLEQRRVASGNVSMYRYHEGNWAPLQTRLQNQTREQLTYRVDSPGLSVFAVVFRGARPLVVESAAVAATDPVTPDEPVSVTATVRNAGTAEATFPVALTADGRTLAARTVTLGPDEAATVRLEATFDDPGTYDLRLAGAVAGTVRVRAPPTTATPGAGPTVTPPPVSGTVEETAAPGGQPGFTPLVTLVALAVLAALAALAAGRRR